MSIASEYAKRVAAAKVKPDSFRWEKGQFATTEAWLDEQGRLVVNQIPLTSEGALALAKWIIFTFGEGNET